MESPAALIPPPVARTLPGTQGGHRWRSVHVRSALPLLAALALVACNSAGTAGPPGPKGDRGDQGIPGDPAPLVAGCQAGQGPQWNGTAWQCVAPYAPPACMTVTLSNRNGASDKYGRFDLPFDCSPPFMSADYPVAPPTRFGCTIEMWIEHHNANNAGYWRGHRSANLAIWPNAEGTGRSYLQTWDRSTADVFDIQDATPTVVFNPHWYPLVCEVEDANYNGSAWTFASPNPSGPGWLGFGMKVQPFTRCTLRVCENRADTGTYGIVERTAGSTAD